MENRNRNLNIQIPGRLKHMDEQTIRQRISTQRDFFATGATLPLSFRLKQLEQLNLALKRHEQDLYTALKSGSWKKAGWKAICVKIGLTLSELTWMQKHLPKLMRCKNRPYSAGTVCSQKVSGRISIRNRTDHESLELPGTPHFRTADRCARRRKYRHPEAKRLRSTHQSDSESASQGMLSTGICNDDHRRPGGKIRHS
mgnify:CR=1 FL=1